MMEISTAWVNYVNKMSQIDAEATKKVGEYISAHKGFDFANYRDMQDLINYSYGISLRYGEASASLACEMYDAVGLASGMFLEPAVPAEVAEYSEVAKAINGTGKTQNPEIVASSIGRLVKMAGQDTTLKNAIRDQAEFAWVTSGDTCAFCIAIASRGWQVASRAVLNGDHADHIHGNCDCCFAIRFNSNTTYKGYDPDKLAEMYYDAPLKEGQKMTAKNRVNALRREFYAENKDKINAQKRAAYAKRMELNSSQAEEKNVN